MRDPAETWLSVLSGFVVGFLVAIMFVAQMIGGYEYIEKSENGWFVAHKGKVYSLQEVVVERPK